MKMAGGSQKRVENIVGKGKIASNFSFSQSVIIDSSKLKEFADDNFKFDENGRKLSKWVENTVGKGKIALRAISPFTIVFSKGLFPRGVKRCHCVGIG